MNGTRAVDALVYDFPKESKNRGGAGKTRQSPFDRGGRPVIVAA
jgi:hypothetical protein